MMRRGYHASEAWAMGEGDGERGRKAPRSAASRSPKSWSTHVDSEGEALSSGSGTGERSGPSPARRGDTQGGLPD